MDHELTTVVGNEAASAQAQLAAPLSAAAPLRGSVLVLIQFDVCEEIRLDVLRNIFGARTADASFKHQAPGYVRYQRPPVEERLEPLILESGERLEGQIKYYDYGVVSLVFELPFSGGWDTLVQLSCRWTSDINFETLATRIVKQKLERAAPALVKPYDVKNGEWLQEDYFIFHVREIEGALSANDLLAAHGDQIAQVVRGEMSMLSEGERQEILQSRTRRSQRSGGDWLERGVHHDILRCRGCDPASAVRELAIARVPPLRRTARPRNWKTSTTSSKSVARDGGRAGVRRMPRPSCTPCCSTSTN